MGGNALRPEWPTLAVFVAFYAGFAGLTLNWESLPLWISLPAAAYLTGLYGSLQHEVIHGHPTQHRQLNHALVFPALLLWVPFERYRDLHLNHHRTDDLTDPYDDPESFYLAPDDWSRLAAPVRALLTANNTLAGRLTLGPAIAAWRFWRQERARLQSGDRAVLQAWLAHIPAVAAVIAWTWGVCGIAPWVFVACFAYPGTALILLRSFAEHRADARPAARSAIVETGPALGLLFLNNNLHALHHARPGLPWYALPRFYRKDRHRILERNGRYLIPGYRHLFRKHLVMPKEPVAHPGGRR